MWPDWAIYFTLGNFSKPVATIILAKLPTFLAIFVKVLKSFLVKSFWANFIDIWRYFFWSHCRLFQYDFVFTFSPQHISWVFGKLAVLKIMEVLFYRETKKIWYHNCHCSFFSHKNNVTYTIEEKKKIAILRFVFESIFKSWRNSQITLSWLRPHLQKELQILIQDTVSRSNMIQRLPVQGSSQMYWFRMVCREKLGRCHHDNENNHFWNDKYPFLLRLDTNRWLFTLCCPWWFKWSFINVLKCFCIYVKTDNQSIFI